VSKLNAAGTALAYSTFLGGSDWDVGYGIAVDGAGQAYVTGDTGSTDFPTTPGAWDTTYNGLDVFVSKLNTAGTALAYSTFLGGSNSDQGFGIAVDGAGRAYVTGDTYSSDFPTTVGAWDRTHNGGTYDAFVSKLNAAGTALAYSTFLGGSDWDWGNDIAVDGAGQAFITGGTDSTGFPTTAGAWDRTYNGGTYDAFVSKLNGAGTALLYSTFLGGNDYDWGPAIAVDGAGQAYVTGMTGSIDFPTTAGTWDTIYNGSTYDAFVSKLNAAGTALAYSTFLGGSNWDYGFGIAVDGAGQAYVTGWTSSTDFPTTPGAFDTTHNGTTDVFVSKLALGGGGTYTLSGRVRDGSGNGIAGVTVAAGAGGSATTAASGDYTITGLVAGTYTLTPAKAGYTFSPPSRTVSVPPDATGQDFAVATGPRWTLMFYLDGDNNLGSVYTLSVFNQLEAAANNPNVRIVALLDRSGTNDSAYYEVQPDTNLARLATYTATVNYWPQGERNMGAVSTLASFVDWARTHYPAQYYALILSNHGSGLGGAMWDDTSSGDYLTVAEIGTALASATLTGTNKIDVLYMDACLMAMIGDAYQVRDYVDYYVASENIKFGLPAPHFQAISGISTTTTPTELATLFTTTYGDVCNEASLPCTMSTADVSGLSNVVTATNSLAQQLNSQMATVAITLTTVRANVQHFQMNGDNVINPSDDYIDLYDFARLVRESFSAGVIQTAAQGVMDAASTYVLTERHRSGATGGATWNLDDSHGVSIFFPSTASSFYSASNYDFAVGATWTRATSLSNTQAATGWGPMLVSYFQVTQPGGPDNPTQPELLPLRPGFEVYLPIALRNR